MLPIVFEDSIEVPEWVEDLESFRRWARSDEFPQRGRIAYFEGKVWIEMSMETVIHNQAKFCISTKLDNHVTKKALGRLFADGMRLTHPEANLSTESDLLFASKETLQRQRLQIKKGAAESELVGTPDMVLEVVSTSSVQKDTVILPQLYWNAGVTEYWLVDPRGKEIRFEIRKRGANGFQPVPARNGWLLSEVFGRAFRLSMTINGFELPVFKLEMKRR